MKTQSNNPYSISSSNDNPTSKSSSTSPKVSKGGYLFWGIQISNIPRSTTESQIGNEFKKYGDIFSVKSLSESSMKIIFKSPKKPTSIEDIINEQTKFKVTPLNSTQLPAGKKTELSNKKPASVKISLMSGPPVSKSGKYNLKKLPLDINTKLIAKNSKLSSSAAPFTSPPRIHTLSTTSKTNNSRNNTTSVNNDNNNNNHNNNSNNDEGVFFEAVCKSITHGTTEEQVLDFIRKNIFPTIKDEVVKDGMMMLPGESMAVFELNNKDAINKLTKIIKDNSSKSNELLFNGNKFTLQRKTNSDDVPPPNVKGLSIKLDDDEQVDNEPPINSNGVNVVNDKNGVDYLMGIGFEHGINTSSKSNKANDDKKEDSNTPKKSYYFKLPDDAKQCVAKQAESLEIPKTSLVLMLGVMTTNGPVPISNFRQWKQHNPNVNQFLSGNKHKIGLKNKGGDIVPNMDALTDSSDKTDALSSNKSAIGLQNNKSFNSNQGSPIGSIGSTPAAAVLFGDTTSNGPLNNPKKTSKKIVASANNSTLTKAPLVKTGSFNKNKVNNNNNNNNNNQTQKRMFQYPNNNPLISNNSLNNNIGLIGPISPRGVGNGVSLIRMKSNGGVSTNGTLLSPTAAALLSPRRNNNNTTLNPNMPAPVVVPNTDFTSPMKGTNVGNGFSMTTPIANLTPVHIPYLGGTGNTGPNGTNGQSPINSGFQSPINYNINTPQSPINYPGITPIINAFTPTASNVNIQTPTANLPFYWNNLHKNNSFNTNNTNNNNNNNSNNGPFNNGPINNMDNDPLAPPNNINSGFPFNSNQSNNPYVQQQLQKNPLLRPPQNNGGNNMGNNGSSPLSKPPSTFFKYPIPSDEPKSSPSNSNNIMNGQMNNGLNNMLNSINSLNSLNQQQSHNSFTDNNNNNNDAFNNYNNNNMNDDDNNNQDEETQMNEPPSLDEINNMRSIPSVISPNGTTPVVMITNLNEDEIDCDKIFTLCGVFGDVQRVKISYHKRDTAFVQLSNHRQAKHVVTSLNRMQLYGKMIHVNLSRMTRVKLPKDSPNSAMMFPDAKFLTKDYTNCKKHRYSKKGAGGIKYSPLSIGQPSHILHIANLPIQSEAKDLQEFLCGNGIFAKQQNQGPRYSNDDKIQSIELIGVNNKLGSCQAFAKCHSVDIACQILIDYHGKEFLGREIKISFATRSHMPSDINKTHKTYSYTAHKRHGASINSIPASIQVQPQNNNNNDNDPNNNNNNNNGPNNNNNGDNMSSSSSSNGQPPLNNNNSYNNNHNSYHSHRNNYGNNMGYNNRHNQVCSFPKNVISNRNSYMANYDNNVGYQTYVINNKQPPPDQDKIFVRQHHHSGGRKYHYKLRINK